MTMICGVLYAQASGHPAPDTVLLVSPYSGGRFSLRFTCALRVKYGCLSSGCVFPERKVKASGISGFRLHMMPSVVRRAHGATAWTCARAHARSRRAKYPAQSRAAPFIASVRNNSRFYQQRCVRGTPFIYVTRRRTRHTVLSDPLCTVCVYYLRPIKDCHSQFL